MSASRGDVRPVEPTRAQRTLARRVAESRATIPSFELSTEVDMLASLTLVHTRSISLTAVVVRACALALREVPRANAAYRDGAFELYSRINIGVAVSSQDTILIPTVFDADRKAPAELSEEIADLSDRAGRGALASPEFSGATFTLWSAGNDAVASTSPVIVPPQAAALSAGAVRAAPVLRDGQLAAGRAMTVTLACDHRILYGESAEAFLAAVQSRLRAGEE